MADILQETKEAAYNYFGTFGFDTVEIESLIALGEEDIRQELARLRDLLRNTPEDTSGIDRRLHALKGLFTQLGNRTLAEKIHALRESIGTQEGRRQINGLDLYEFDPKKTKK